MKDLRFPDLLLLFLLVPVLLSNRYGTFDIQVHDTYFVIAHVHFLTIITVILGVTWIGHQLCRKYDLLAKGWRWMQVVLSVLSLGTLLVVSSFVLKEPLSYRNIQLMMYCDEAREQSILIFVLTQLVFWLVVVVKFVVRAVRM
ncbi:MAG: hypothetical protein JST68_22340 [Bacteroidetes bacterium]|nr:hypothetical protein [Bacteroidota bacterium]